MMVAAERPFFYKFGVMLFFISGLVFLVGFACPYWTRLDRTEKLASGDLLIVLSNQGLWHNCTKISHTDTECTSTVGDSSPIWLKAVRTFQCLSLAGYVLTTCYLIVVTFITRSKNFNRLLENFMMATGLLGVVGATIYAAELSRAHEALQKVYAESGVFTVDPDHVSWAFVLDILGCLVSFVAGILVAVFNRPAPHDDDDDDKPESASSYPSNGVSKGANQQPPRIAPQPMAANDSGTGQAAGSEAYEGSAEQSVDTKM